MAKKNQSATDARLGKVLNLAKQTATSELGAGASNKDVEAAATLATAVTENGTTTRTKVKAGVSLGVSSSSEEAKGEGCCNGCKNCGCC